MSHQNAPPNADHTPDITPRQAIRDRITQQLSRKSEADCNDSRHRFIPRAALLDVIDLGCVEEILQTIPIEGDQNESFKQKVAQQVCPQPRKCFCANAYCTGRRMIFSILLLCAREDLLLSPFFQRTPQICDLDLPFRFDQLIDIPDIDHKISTKEKGLFLNKQWQVYTPLLTEYDPRVDKDVEMFDDEAALPWARKRRIGKRMPGEVSFVERVEIYRCSHNLVSEVPGIFVQESRSHSIQTHGDDQAFALKTFEQRLAPGLSEKRFHHEVKANLEAPRHERIVRLLTAFEYRERFYILFPYANEISLERLWRSYNPPGVDQEPREFMSAHWYTDDWLVQECLGIASALAATHGLDDDLQGAAKVLLHADIKPENILCFRNSGSDIPVKLKLADFGEAKVFEPTDPLKANKVAHVMTYRPPEHSPGNILTLKYDVWCLGCLFLDFITWAILGQDGIDSFSSIREDEQSGSGEIIEDTFFKRNPGSIFFTKLGLGFSKELNVDYGRSTTKYSLWIDSQLKLTPRLKDGVASVSTNGSLFLVF